ncbi:MAG: hypothetical protein GY929_05335 [Actinomycetia bacterium]|nr:hypothetical protein [Actinomycetes bacterium]
MLDHRAGECRRVKVQQLVLALAPFEQLDHLAVELGVPLRERPQQLPPFAVTGVEDPIEGPLDLRPPLRET